MTVGLYLKTKDFQTIYEEKNLAVPTNWEIDIVKEIDKLFEKNYNSKIIYRSSGVVLSHLISNMQTQHSLFEDTENTEKAEKLSNCIDLIETKFGRNFIKTGFTKNIKDI